MPQLPPLWAALHRGYEVLAKHSLWREFVWPYYHTGDESCMNNALKVCGQHASRLCFPHHVTPPKLVKILDYCSNVIELSLPTTKLDPDQLAKVVQNVEHLWLLDIQWNSNIKQLLELVGMSLEELSIRMDRILVHSEYFNSTESWLHYWMSREFIPRKLNIVTAYFASFTIQAIWKYWNTLNSDGHTGHVKIYSGQKTPLNFLPILPEFQLDFGQGVKSPLVMGSSVGTHWNNWFLLTDCIYKGKVMCRAKMKQIFAHIRVESVDQLNHNITDLGCVTEFVPEVYGFDSEYLQQLSIVCPNLQRLNLHKNTNCLRSLQGLHAIANSCHNLQGLNLGVTAVEDHALLWEIL